ncbi:DCD (Development and Cell Death) domain protein [Euphorbia peplus]|nr:DCD (Development and Cell Death) domain protein [Euphorbia peplus]
MEGEAASSSTRETYGSDMEDEILNFNTSKNVYNEIETAFSDEDEDDELVFSRGGKRKKDYLIDSDDEEGEDFEVKISADEETNAETLGTDECAKESDIAYNKDSTYMSEELDIEDLMYDEVVHEEDAKEEVKNEEQVQAIPKKKIVKSRKRLKKCSTKIASKGMNEVIVKDKNLPEPVNKNLQLMNDWDALEKEEENNRMCSEEPMEDTSEKKIGKRRWGGKGSKKKIAVKRKEDVIVKDACDGEPNDKENGDGGVVHEENAKEGMKDEKQVEENYEKKINKSKIGLGKGLKKSIVLWDVNEVIVKDMNDPESSNRTTTKKAKIMGMIFMCSAKTKKDCFRYKILGLPSNKRDEVLNISKGMKLFLFDVDSKLLHGIYKAAGPGGYNIEPKAFKSAFPSQVRFNIFQDCEPLPEEKFKKVIKDNYFKKNKFHSQLTLKQVKNLCKLFKPATKPERLWRDPEAHTRKAPPSEPRRSRRDVRAPIYKDKDNSRKRNSGAETRALVNRNRNHALVNRDHSRKRRSPETRAFSHQERSRKRHRDAYDRNEYSSPVLLPPPRALLPPPSARELSPGSFAYEGRLEMNGYRRDSLIDHHDRRFRDLELRQGVHHDDRVRDSFQDHHDRWFLDSRSRHREDIEYREPYVVYRELPSYHDRSYSDAQPSEYLGPARTSRYDDVSRPRVGLYDSYIGARSWY